eukprot:1359929-Amorphochlora_amoeboformis.AAC.1
MPMMHMNAAALQKNVDVILGALATKKATPVSLRGGPHPGLATRHGAQVSSVQALGEVCKNPGNLELSGTLPKYGVKNYDDRSIKICPHISIKFSHGVREVIENYTSYVLDLLTMDPPSQDDDLDYLLQDNTEVVQTMALGVIQARRNVGEKELDDFA